MDAETGARIVGFLRGIGLPLRETNLPEDCFLPGIRIERGGLAYDPRRIRHWGDLLHEAGHLAVVPVAERAGLDAALPADGGAEMAAIAWSYAACRYLGLDSRVLFHVDGYKGEADWLAGQFDAGRYIGVPILVWRGLTGDLAEHAEEDRYPAMRRWLCD